MRFIGAQSASLPLKFHPRIALDGAPDVYPMATSIPPVMLSKSSRNGFHTYVFANLRELRDALENEVGFLNSGDYVFRGQRDAQWRLESSLARKLREVSPTIKQDVRLRHFEEVMEQCFIDGRLSEGTVHRARAWMRERREMKDEPGPDGTGRSPEGVQDVVDVWSVAQHYNAPTPLLDWSRSLFSAAFFAYYNYVRNSDFPRCAIFAINRTLVTELSKEQAKMESEGQGGFYFVEASGKYNARIVAQRGLFTFSRSDMPVERWITLSTAKTDTWKELPLLIKFVLPTGARAAAEALEFLASYGVDIGQVFPDFDGRIRQVVANLDKVIQHERTY
jgi:hypothetical protein